MNRVSPFFLALLAALAGCSKPVEPNGVPTGSLTGKPVELIVEKTIPPEASSVGSSAQVLNQAPANLPVRKNGPAAEAPKVVQP